MRQLLACQHDAYARTLSTTVLQHADGAEVLLEDTLLYPEGGGQPDDHGTLDGVPVVGLRKQEDDGRVFHRLPPGTPLPAVGTTVTLAVDWARRFDHMQQHTAQHLLSALAADRLGAETTAFHLRPDVCDIDLSRALSSEEVAALEQWAGAAIREARPVQARVFDSAADLAAGGVRTRGLPDGFAGPVRLVEIAGLDRNTCGGTHVASTAELQVISLLPPLAHKGGCKLRYLAGGRVLVGLHAAQERELVLSRLLSCGPEDHATAVERLQQSAKDSARALKHLQGELATLAGAELARQAVPVLRRDDADMNFLRAAAGAATEAAPDRTFLLLGEGLFMLAGPPEPVAALGPQIAAILGGRGGGARGRYQGRFEQAAGIDAAIRHLEQVT